MSENIFCFYNNKSFSFPIGCFMQFKIFYMCIILNQNKVNSALIPFFPSGSSIHSKILLDNSFFFWK